MNTTDLLRSLQDLFRRHPQPWRLSAFTYYDMNDRAVSLDVCADLLAAFGFDIVSLAEQCAEYGAPEDVKFAAADEIAEFEKASTAAEEELRRDFEDSEAEVRRLEQAVDRLTLENKGLYLMVDDLQAEIERLERNFYD